MRPAGDVSKALLLAVQQLATAERAPILKELAAHTNLPEGLVMQTLKNMKRYDRVCIARTRRVPWCTRPVAEFDVPVVGRVAANDAMGDVGFAALARAWG